MSDVNCCRCCGASLIGPKGEVLMVCVPCTTRDSYKALLAMQQEFLPAVVASDYQLTLRRRAGKKEWHIEMLGYAGQGFCGVLLNEFAKGRSEWSQRKKKYSELDRETGICPECRTVLANKATAVAMEAR